MEAILRPIFGVLTVPDLKVNQPIWICFNFQFGLFLSRISAGEAAILDLPPLCLDSLRLHPRHLLPRNRRHHLRCHRGATQRGKQDLFQSNFGFVLTDICVQGSTTDEHGHTRPVAFMPYRVNGQYIMEVDNSALRFLKSSKDLFLFYYNISS